MCICKAEFEVVSDWCEVDWATLKVLCHQDTGETGNSQPHHDCRAPSGLWFRRNPLFQKLGLYVITLVTTHQLQLIGVHSHGEALTLAVLHRGRVQFNCCACFSSFTSWSVAASHMSRRSPVHNGWLSRVQQSGFDLLSSGTIRAEKQIHANINDLTYISNPVTEMSWLQQ